MNHRLKHFLVTMTLSALAVALAPPLAAAVEHKIQAAQFIPKVGKGETAKIDSQQIGTNTFTVNALSITCATNTGSGKTLTAGGASTEVSITPLYETCHVVIAGLTKTVTITVNKCAYILNATTTTAESGALSNPADTSVSCENKGEALQIHIYSTANTETTTTCTYDLEPQGPLTGTTLTNQTNTPGSANDIKADFTINLSVNNTIKNAVCGQNATETMKAAGETTLRATNAKSEYVDLSAGLILDETLSGLFTASVGSKVIAGIDTEQIASTTFEVNGLSLTCTTAKLTGNSLNTGPSFTEITLTPKFETCHVVIGGLTKLATLTTNHCGFVVNALTTTEEGGSISYPAEMEVECEHAGEAIQIHVYNSKTGESETLCTFDIEAQGPFGGSELINNVNTPTSPDDLIAEIDLGVTVQNTIKNGTCGEAGTSTGFLRGEDTLQATNVAGEAVETSVS